jgi:hypothetical protein
MLSPEEIDNFFNIYWDLAIKEIQENRAEKEKKRIESK